LVPINIIILRKPTYDFCLVLPTTQNLYRKLSTYWIVVKTYKKDPRLNWLIGLSWAFNASWLVVKGIVATLLESRQLQLRGDQAGYNARCFLQQPIRYG